MITSYHKRLRGVLVPISLFACACCAAGQVAFSSNFSQQRDGWQGRAGLNSFAPQVDLADIDGVPCLSIRTDGRVGTGVHWKSPTDLKVGIPYKLSFRIKKNATELITYRITDHAGTRSGDESRAWQKVTETDLDLDKWIQVHFVFTPITPRIGIDIAAGAEHPGFPFDLKIADFVIEEFK